MNVSLTPELEAWIAERVKTGRYRSSSEVVREAVRLLQDRAELEALHRDELKKRVGAGLSELDAGLGATFDEGVLARIKSRGRSALGENSA